MIVHSHNPIDQNSVKQDNKELVELLEYQTKEIQDEIKDFEIKMKDNNQVTPYSKLFQIQQEIDYLRRIIVIDLNEGCSNFLNGDFTEEQIEELFGVNSEATPTNFTNKINELNYFKHCPMYSRLTSLYNKVNNYLSLRDWF